MKDEITHHVTIRLARGYEFVAEFNDFPEVPAILFDEPAPVGEGRAPNAAAMLAAAVGDCLAASFAFCVRKAHIKLDDLTADVTARVARNDRGRFRIESIDVELTPTLLEGDPARMARCQSLFEDFCMVTESVRRGIPVNVAVTGVTCDESRAARTGQPSTSAA